MPMTTQQDGNIVAARERLAEAIHALIDERPVPLFLEGGGTEVTWVDSYYVQLAGSVAGQNVAEKGDSRQGRVPIWVDAVDLIREIDATVAVWERSRPAPGTNEPTTVLRLKALAGASFRPQDTHKVNRWAGSVRTWVDQIKRLLDPEGIKHISEPCPACGATKVYRRDSSGQLVRQPALQLVTNQGCTCMACKTFWEPTKYLFLCKLLGFDLPEGVLE